VGYLTAGFPNRRHFKENLAIVAGGCDVVEIGVPFTDPMATAPPFSVPASRRWPTA